MSDTTFINELMATGVPWQTAQLLGVSGGIGGAVAASVAASATTAIINPTTVFTSVAASGKAQLNVANGVSMVLNRCGTGALLSVIPDTGGQIESYGTNAAVGVPDGGNAIFIPNETGAVQWWVI